MEDQSSTVPLHKRDAHSNKVPIKFAEPGHYYSPICDPTELEAYQHQIWPQLPFQESAGVEYNIPGQIALLRVMQSFVADIDFPLEAASELQYYYANDQFSCLDAEVLFCLLRHVKPKTVIEVGSGFSTLVISEVNRRFLNGKLNLWCIEPFPRHFLLNDQSGVIGVIAKPVQAISPLFFKSLGSGDVLFIDCSHVSKTGSDVNYLLFEVIPRLETGVYIHIHDIFLPDEYPRVWAIDEGRNWNEQYLIRAFLQFNASFEVIWASHLMASRCTEQILNVFPRVARLGAGGSLWLRKRV